jgi:hypothetical protein
MSTISDLRDALANETYIRLNLDDSSHEGFVVGLSDTLLLLQVVYEWQDTGALVVPVARVESIDVSDHHDDQVKILAFNSVKRTKRYAGIKLVNLSELFKSLKPKNRFVVISVEDESDVGQIDAVEADQVVIKAVDPGGNWTGDELECPFEDITAVQFDDSYSRVLQRYVERTAQLN